VANFLAQEYIMDKAGARAALFGPEPGMEQEHLPESAAKKVGTAQDMIERVGPWGAVRRAR